MAVVGWIIVTVLAAGFGIAGLLLMALGGQFSGKFCTESLFPLGISALLFWASYANSPFVLSIAQ